MIASVSLRRLARRDPARAAELFWRLDSHFAWLAEERAQILRDIALQAAVALDPIALDLVPQIASEFRDGQLQEWWARSAIAARDWSTLADIVKQMPDELAADGRWRYWHAHALSQLGLRDESLRLLSALSIESTFYGFRAADALDRPYTICPKEPEVDSAEVARLRKDSRFSRAIELRAIGLDDWAVSEWVLAAAALAPDRLRTAAALAWEQEWYDRVIFALGDSGDRRYYDWRFPLVWESVISRAGNAGDCPASLPSLRNQLQRPTGIARGRDQHYLRHDLHAGIAGSLRSKSGAGGRCLQRRSWGS
jgi:soluble lytic murein transglycosylase